MKKTTEPHDRKRLLEEIRALRTRVHELEETQAAGSNANLPVSAVNPLSPTSHPQAFPPGTPPFPISGWLKS